MEEADGEGCPAATGARAAAVGVSRMRAPVGSFDDVRPARDCLGLLTAPVADAVRNRQGDVPLHDLVHVDSDPEIADTAAFVEHYGQELLGVSANRVVAGKRGGETTLAARPVLSRTRLDVNGAVRRQLGVRKASFAPRGTATGGTGMA